MKKNLILISVCLSLIAFVSCSPQPHSVTHPVKSDENLLISSSAAVSSGLLRDSDDIKHYCASVAPDATFNEAVSEGTSISLFTIGRSSPEKESVSAESKETQMVGRTPAVLVSREMLYRVCELTGNRSLTNREALKLYEKAIDAIVQLASQEMANTSIGLGFSLGSWQYRVEQEYLKQEQEKTSISAIYDDNCTRLTFSFENRYQDLGSSEPVKSLTLRVQLKPFAKFVVSQGADQITF